MSTGGTISGEVLNVAEVRVYLSPVGTIAPVDAVTIPADTWFGVGHTTEDNLSFKTDVAFNEFKSAQSRGKVVKRVQTGDDASIAVVLTQWNTRNLQAAFGGGKVTAVTPATNPPTYRFVPAKLGERTEVAVIVDLYEGSKRYRFVFPRCFQTEGVSIDLNIGSTSQLPLGLSVLAVDDADSFYMLTNTALAVST